VWLPITIENLGRTGTTQISPTIALLRGWNIPPVFLKRGSVFYIYIRDKMGGHLRSFPLSPTPHFFGVGSFWAHVY
jgi:hypothetical protein